MEILHNELDLEESHNKSRTLIRDVLARYSENKKFITANVINENIDGINLELLKD